MNSLHESIASADLEAIRNRLAAWTPSAIADEIRSLSAAEQAVVIRVLPRDRAAATFGILDREMQESLLKALGQAEVASILNDMAPDDRTGLLDECPAEVTKSLLALLSPEQRRLALSLLGYARGSVGRLMTPHYVAIKAEWTVQAVLDHIRRVGRDSETLSMLYVVGEDGVLVDDINIREFLLSDPDRFVSQIMDYRFVALRATDGENAAIALFRQHDLKALPVTDTNGVLIGIVTIDDVLSAVETRATKEIQKIGGSEAFDEPYMSIAFGRMIKKRAGWLVVLFLGEMLTATAMGFFEGEIEKAVVLALFVPLIISSGGNSGSQATTLVIRALALGEVRLRDWWRVMRREILAGFALGSILGAIGFFRIFVWAQFSSIYGAHYLLVAITVGVSLIGIVMWGTMAGSMLPLILRRLGLDPATSSAPFVATLVDVTGLVIYFSVAYVFLRGTLL
jgi:magnesium transporter